MPARYRHTRDQSAEILRLALAHMGRQQAAFYPVSYALWYEHVSGTNPALSRVLEERIKAASPLTDAEVARLYIQYISPREGEAVESIQERLRMLLEQTLRAVSNTGIHAVQFGEALGDHTMRLKQPESVQSIQTIVNELVTETHRMCEVNTELSRQLDTSSKEVLHLTQQLAQVQTEAFRDPLTGLLNRRGFERAVSELGARPVELTGNALLVADIDHFKRINDSHGHLVGDQVLRAVAQVLRARTKGADITARLGGDEFAVLLPRTAMVGAKALAEQIRTTLFEGRIRRIDREEYIEDVTLSVGVAEGRAGDTLEDLLNRADTALYAAKRSGRNQVVWESPAT